MVIKARAERKHGTPAAAIPAAARASGGEESVTGGRTTRTKQAPVLARPQGVQPNMRTVSHQGTPTRRKTDGANVSSGGDNIRGPALQALEPTRGPMREGGRRLAPARIPWDTTLTLGDLGPPFPRPFATTPCAAPTTRGRLETVLVGRRGGHDRPARPAAGGQDQPAPTRGSLGRSSTKAARKRRVTTGMRAPGGQGAAFPLQLVGTRWGVAHGPIDNDTTTGPTFGGGAGRGRARTNALARAHPSPLGALNLQLLHSGEVALDGQQGFIPSGPGPYKLRGRAPQLGGGARDPVYQVVAEPVGIRDPALDGHSGLQVRGHPPRKDRRSSHAQPKIRILPVEQTLSFASEKVGNAIRHVLTVSDNDTSATRGGGLSRPKRSAELRPADRLAPDAASGLEEPFPILLPSYGPSGRTQLRIPSTNSTAIGPADGERANARGQVGGRLPAALPLEDPRARRCPSRDEDLFPKEATQRPVGPATQGFVPHLGLGGAFPKLMPRGFGLPARGAGARVVPPFGSLGLSDGAAHKDATQSSLVTFGRTGTPKEGGTGMRVRAVNKVRKLATRGRNSADLLLPMRLQ